MDIFFLPRSLPVVTVAITQDCTPFILMLELLVMVLAVDAPLYGDGHILGYGKRFTHSMWGHQGVKSGFAIWKAKTVTQPSSPPTHTVIN